MFRFAGGASAAEQQFRFAELAETGSLAESPLTQLARITLEHTIAPLGSSEQQLSQYPADQLLFDPTGLPLSVEPPVSSSRIS